MAANAQTPRHVFICGAKSVGQYGGYETFVAKLAEYLAGDQDIRLHIACRRSGQGSMDESRLPGAETVSPGEFTYCGARCFKVDVPDIGPASAVWYDVKAVRSCLRYCREQGIRRPIVYILACRIGPFSGGLRRRIKRLGGEMYVNPDGHEWLRQKWPAPVRRYWKLSEKGMVKQANLLVCDSEHIQAYIEREYARFHPHTVYIAYGAETAPSPLSDEAPAYTAWLKEHGLQRGEYYLAVGRLVPENNYETMIREYLRCGTPRPFVLITNENEALKGRLEEKTGFSRDGRVRFVGPVYDQALLKKIREGARGYLHGHEVGGTNPSLLEALGSTKVNLLLDVGFNREVGREAALYWQKEPGSLAALIDRADALTDAERQALGRAAGERIREAYTWEKIAGAYRELFRGEE